MASAREDDVRTTDDDDALKRTAETTSARAQAAKHQSERRGVRVALMGQRRVGARAGMETVY